MRTRAYRPEAPDCLEDRSLFSGAAGPWADPVVFSKSQLDRVLTQYQISFEMFPRDPSISDLRIALSDVVVLIPFGRVDGLGVKINRILHTMREDIIAKDRYAVPWAAHAVVAVTLAEVAARVRDGDVILR